MTRHPSGIVPQLQNMVATVNLSCKLDLKQIALHARNSEYNPKARLGRSPSQRRDQTVLSVTELSPSYAVAAALCGRHHEDTRAEDDRSGLRLRQNGGAQRPNTPTSPLKPCIKPFHTLDFANTLALAAKRSGRTGLHGC